MDIIVKTANFIWARACNHKQLSSFVSTMNSEYGELYHIEVRLLSQGHVLTQNVFFTLIDKIGLFMSMKEKDVSELSDLAFIPQRSERPFENGKLEALGSKADYHDEVWTEYTSVVGKAACWF